MNIYLDNINDNQIKTNLQQFISRFDLEPLWIFLTCFRRFLQRFCKSNIKNTHQLSLKLYLQNLPDIDYDLIQYFPEQITLNQAGYAYKYSAQKYKQRCNRENVKKYIEKDKK